LVYADGFFVKSARSRITEAPLCPQSRRAPAGKSGHCNAVDA
jgi:hypothetical protein